MGSNQWFSTTTALPLNLDNLQVFFRNPSLSKICQSCEMYEKSFRSNYNVMCWYLFPEFLPTKKQIGMNSLRCESYHAIISVCYLKQFILIFCKLIYRTRLFYYGIFQAAYRDPYIADKDTELKIFLFPGNPAQTLAVRGKHSLAAEPTRGWQPVYTRSTSAQHLTNTSKLYWLFLSYLLEKRYTKSKNPKNLNHLFSQPYKLKISPLFSKI